MEQHPQHQNTEMPAKSTAGQLILQWLTYAFWGWLAFILSILFTTIMANFIEGADTSGFAPYGISAVLVLLPLAAVCDFFYSKYENPKKSGGSSVIMVLHAVLFALVAVGSLIGFVFSVVQLLVESNVDNKVSVIAIISTLFAAILFGLLFVRTLQPLKLSVLLKKLFALLITLISTVVIILAFTGPVAYGRATKNDRLISENLSRVSDAVNDYAQENNKLPDNLDAVSLEQDAAKIVDEGWVEYKPNTRQATRKSTAYNYTDDAKVFYYQLCVTYKESKRLSSVRRYPDTTDRGYVSYPSTYSHPAGEVCYKLQTNNY